jgi:hypothetical protein
LLFAVGCGPRTLSRQEYLIRANAIAHDFYDFQTASSKKPLPNFKGLSRSEKLRALADNIRANADKDDSFSRRMAALTPPSGLADHKQAFLSLFGGLSLHLRAWADAIQSGDRKKEDAAGRTVDTFLIHSVDLLIAVTERHGEDASSLKRSRAALIAELQ